MSATYDVTFISLDSISIANSCLAQWERMKGDDWTRFCQTCAKNVYNLSAMSRAEAKTLINGKEGKLCARYYARADGPIITADCSVGMRERQRLLWRNLSAGLVASVALGGARLGIGNRQTTIHTSLHTLADLRQRISDQFFPQASTGNVAAPPMKPSAEAQSKP